ncbi:phosphoglycerate dehydrogenase-like enzyme [Phyllobacterium trifolii]|uniref:Phosphoglycerate dehydrogenase-like enzyme n=1 Tax=Phyllobacterium trifolii TaxID=300193 RepID=A0A839UI65_9HYPH|nr:D-2-hydroxyacid dehydrogenase [Phyllobacterium trifolii]MBB3149494.1 phosphoglycerate dehydrogenase-like enzyme [Phyllobacterium trifolii]
MKILVQRNVNETRRAQLLSKAPNAHVVYCTVEGEVEAMIGDVDVVAGFVSPPALAKASRLKWLHSWMAGPDRQLYPEFVASDVVLTCSKGNGAVPLAEHAIMLMLMLNRNALRWLKAQDDHRWDHFVHGELNGLTCGIIGAGFSGQDLALKAKAFHMNVIGLRRHDRPAPNFDRFYNIAEIKDFMAESDFVVVTAPKTAETTGMLGEREFRAMKKSAFYICFSRGGIADDVSLLRALNEGWIAGAGLDAHSEEPLPATSPFWTAPNTIVTPHNGATSKATPERGFDYFVANLERYQNGEALINLVDRELAY